MSLSRSPSTVTMAALASSGLAASAVAIQRCDSLSDNSRRSCKMVRRPLRVHTSPPNRPRQLPFSASTASIECSNTPWPLPLPISPSPRRRLAVVAKLISLVSWIASIWRPSAAATVPSLQLSMIRAVVTLALPRKRLNRTSRPRLPFASRRRQTSLPATMHSMSAAPLYRDDDPRTDTVTSQFAPACRHLCQSRSVVIEITQIPDSGIPLDRPESICRTRCVHALALSRGRHLFLRQLQRHDPPPPSRCHRRRRRAGAGSGLKTLAALRVRPPPPRRGEGHAVFRPGAGMEHRDQLRLVSER